MKKVKRCFKFNGYVSPGLWGEILSHLPLKVIIRFRSVSRLWKSIIGNSNFISLHLRHCPNNIQNPYLIFFEQQKFRDLHRWVLRPSKKYCKVLKIEFPGEDARMWNIRGGGVHGLILLLGMDYQDNVNVNIIIWNPSMHKSIHLHPPTLPDLWIQCGRCKDLKVCLGLLFDASSDEYKVITIRYRLDVVFKSISAPLVDVYSLKSRSWLRVKDTHRSCVRIMFDDCSTCIGGSAHWTGMDYSEFLRSQCQVRNFYVISFHPTSNMFSYTPLPNEATKEAQRRRVIVFPKSTLGLLVEFRYKIIIWAKESSSIGSPAFDGSANPQCCWTIRYQINLERQVDLNYSVGLAEVFYVPVSQQKQGVLLWGSKSLQTYDLDTDELKLLVEKYLCRPKYIGPYKESLLLLDYEAAPRHGLTKDGFLRALKRWA